MRRIKLAFIASCAALVATTAGAADLEVNSVIDAVTVYPDGAAVTRVIRIDVPAGDSVLRAVDFPPTLDPSSLRVEGEGGARLMIGAIDARPPRAEPPRVAPEIESRIEALRDERGTLDDKITAAAAEKKFAQRFAETAPAGLGGKGEARPLAEWRAAFAAVADEVANADAAIRAAKVRQREIDRELARLEAQRTANPPRKMEVRIDLSSDAAASATFRVTYTVPGARWAPLYDARLDSGGSDRKPSLELVRRAEIVQATGEDWTDVALAVSTVRTAKGGSAPELVPMVVRFFEPLAQPAQAASSTARVLRREADKLEQERADQPALRGNFRFGGGGDSDLRAADEAKIRPAEQFNATLETGGFQAVFRVPGRISVATNEGAKSFRISTATVAPKLLVRATPALDLAAYLEAGFRHAEEAPLLPGRIALYRDGVFVGRGQMALAAKDEPVRLGFGVDDQVRVERITVRRSEGSAGLLSTAKTDEREFKLTVRNGHVGPIRVALEDQLPVSEVEDVKVEMLSTTTPPTERDARSRRGVMAWTFDAAAGEKREIIFGWSVRWPAGKAVAYGQGQS